MLSFIKGDKVVEAFLKLKGESASADLAVAFWGEGSATQLKIQKNSNTRIICNLESGACNPDEIEKLRRLANIKTQKELHAKVYSTKKGAIIGSSNASTNGLAIPASDARWWREANVVVNNKRILARIAKWFEKEWSDAKTITDSDIQRARVQWGKRSSMAPHRKKKGETLIAALKSNPELLKATKIYCLVYSEGLDAGAKRAWTNITPPEGVSPYQPVKPFEAGSWLISCDFEDQKYPSITGRDSYLEVSGKVLTWPSEDEQELPLYAAHRKSAINLGSQAYKLSEQEKSDLLKKLKKNHFKQLKKAWDMGDALIPLKDLIY